MSISVDLFREVPLFADLEDADLESLIAVATRRKFPKDSVIFFEHDPGDSLFMILSGRVKVTILSDDGREIILSVLGEKDFFGEMSLLDNEPRSATAIAMEDTEVVILHQREFLSIVEKRPRILVLLLAVVSSRLRKANHQIGSLALLDVYQRVTRLLLKLAVEQDGKPVVNQRPSQQDIANQTGASREMVGRVMKELAIGGYITIEDKRIVIEKKLPTGW